MTTENHEPPTQETGSTSENDAASSAELEASIEPSADGQLDATPPSHREAQSKTPIAGAWRVGRMLLAPILAITAVGVHFILNVPSERTISDNKRQAEDQRKRDEAERRAKAPSPKTPYTPRNGAELARLEKQYRGTPFAKEPLISEWSRKGQSFINRAISVARKQAFADMEKRPTVSIRELRCRTVRCRFIVRANTQDIANQFVSTFKELKPEGKSIWRAFETKKTLGGGDAATEIRVTVALVEDQPDPKMFTDKSGEPGPGAEESEGAPVAETSRTSSAKGTKKGTTAPPRSGSPVGRKPVGDDPPSNSGKPAPSSGKPAPSSGKPPTAEKPARTVKPPAKPASDASTAAVKPSSAPTP